MPTIQLPAGFQTEYEAAETVDARDRVIDRCFDCEPVGSEANICPEAIYYVRDKQRQLVIIEAAGQDADAYLLTFVLTGERTRPMPRGTLLGLGRDARLLRLVPKAAADGTELERPNTPADKQSVPPDPKKLHPACTVDMGTLTQLLAAARQSGLLPNADQIAHVRDCEFRMGKYSRALDTIERMSVRFTQAADKRKQKLRAEDIQHKSGTLKMSPQTMAAKGAKRFRAVAGYRKSPQKIRARARRASTIGAHSMTVLPSLCKSSRKHKLAQSLAAVHC